MRTTFQSSHPSDTTTITIMMLITTHCLCHQIDPTKAPISRAKSMQVQPSNHTTYFVDKDKMAAPSTNQMNATSLVDFDDFSALKLSDFYLSSASNRKQANRTTRLKSKLNQMFFQETNNTNYEPSESIQLNNAAGGSLCALPLASGACITFQVLEAAIRRARQSLAFSVDGDLSSLEPSESTLHAIGELNEQVARILALQFGLSADEVNQQLEMIDIRRTSLWRSCPLIFRLPLARSCLYGSALFDGRNPNLNDPLMRQYLMERYRSHSGLCNNLQEPRLGSTFTPFVRLAAPDYADGVGLPRRASSGGPLPPARLVAQTLHPADVQTDHSDLSMMFVNWGQLINHDLAMASNARGTTGHSSSCCKYALSTSGRRAAATAANWGDPDWRVCMPIEISPLDPVYGPFRIRCQEFKRSLAGLRPGCSLGPRTQVNTVTSFVDGSFVYGSTRAVSRSIRSRRRPGQLAVWDYFGRLRAAEGRPSALAARLPLKPLLPPQMNEPDEECVGRRREGQFCFLSGDARTNQQVPLVALHTIHVRQHNRLAEALRLINPHWSGGRLYEESRHIHVALIQHILISEYLPLLLGPRQCDRYNLSEQSVELGSSGDGDDVEYDHQVYWDHYDPTLNAGISQEFAAAAFRQGHSQVASLLYRLHPQTRQLRQVLPLRQTFRQPWPLFQPGAMDEFLVGIVETPAKSLDPFVSQELSGHLLQELGQPVGLDLVSINIQRGRDQGVASYNAMREWCGLKRFVDFEELEQVMSSESGQLMGHLYESVDDIDLFSGGLSELPLEGALVGPTFACIIGQQFSDLRAGDRFWFESSQGAHSFSAAQLASIKQVSLARLICANSDFIDAIQPLAMRLPHPILNPLQPCGSLPDVDLTLWLDLARPVDVNRVTSVQANNDQDSYDQDNDDDDDGFR